MRIIEAQADRMRDLIGSLLDVARIESGALSVTPEPVRVAALVDEARNAFGAGEPGRTLTLDLEPDLPWVHGRPAAHHPSAGQPAVQRGPQLAARRRHPGQRGPAAAR